MGKLTVYKGRKSDKDHDDVDRKEVSRIMGHTRSSLAKMCGFSLSVSNIVLVSMKGKT